MNRPLVNFKTANPTGEAPGIEPVRLELLKAAVNNTPVPPQPTAAPSPVASVAVAAPALHPIPLVNKNIRLPADLVDFIDYTYTKTRRMKKQDAYTEALEAFFRPLMTE